MSVFTNTVLITGGTTGLGYEAALAIARQNPQYQIIIASRSDARSAAATINKTLNHDNVVYLPLDLSDHAKIRRFVAQYAEKGFPPIKALLLNAALQFPGAVEYSADGIEKTLATTHVGHALLFYLLLTYLAEDTRIIVTSSGTHDPAQKTGFPDAKYTSAEELAHPSPESAKNEGIQRYATKRRWAVNAFDPGLMPGTGLAREYNAFLRFVWNSILPRIIPVLRRLINPNIHTTRESGENLARLAIGKDVEGISGVYYEGPKQIKSSTVSYEEDKQEELYTWTLKVIAKDEEEQRGFESVYTS